MHKLYDCNKTGHGTVEWKSDDAKSIRLAEERFNQIVNEEKRFVFDKETGRRLDKFDKDVKEMTAIPVVVGG